ncbi:hypothetical protein JTB14_023569 [Gonioctena quinquepunctata]|nr:hypothetical protein JTB14_023569 [Gonioctena quinquepunctata]
MQPLLALWDRNLSQLVYDNADFNTFHSMGGILCVTPRTAVMPGHNIPRLKNLPTSRNCWTFSTIVNCGCRKIGLFCRRLCDCDGHCSNQEIIFDEDDGTDDLLESPFPSDNLQEVLISYNLACNILSVLVDPPTDESQPGHKRPKLSPLDTLGPSGL